MMPIEIGSAMGVHPPVVRRWQSGYSRQRTRIVTFYRLPVKAVGFMMRVFMLLVLLGLSAGLLMAQPYIPPTPVVPSVGEPTPTLPPVYTLPCQLFDSDLSPELDRPWMHPELPCLEQIAADPSAGEWGYTGLAVADDGRLFAARPLTGEILMFTDTDGEGAPDSPRPIAAGLDQPWALDWHAGELYIRGARAVYVWTPDAIRVLVDDLPPAEKRSTSRSARRAISALSISLSAARSCASTALIGGAPSAPRGCAPDRISSCTMACSGSPTPRAPACSGSTRSMRSTGWN
jgi:hypothetical protein